MAPAVPLHLIYIKVARAILVYFWCCSSEGAPKSSRLMLHDMLSVLLRDADISRPPARSIEAQSAAHVAPQPETACCPPSRSS